MLAGECLLALPWKGRKANSGQAGAVHSRMARASKPRHSRQNAVTAVFRDFPAQERFRRPRHLRGADSHLKMRFWSQIDGVTGGFAAEDFMVRLCFDVFL